MTRRLETAWANHSEKLHGPPSEHEAVTPQSLIETYNIHSQVTHKVQTKAVGSAEERFVQAVQLASCDLNMKTGSGQGVHLLLPTGVSPISMAEGCSSAARKKTIPRMISVTAPTTMPTGSRMTIIKHTPLAMVM